MEADEIRLLVTGESFIGQLDSNPDLAQDAYRQLYESFEIAHREKVHSMFFLGNLFMENTPSNEALTNTISVFHQQVLGDGEIEISVRKLPVFAIHGAQDCPSAESLTSNLDVLHHAGLLNYVGKLTQFEDIEIKPIIFEKKKTKLAVYFLGHIREIKLSALLATNKIKFKAADAGYVKILVVNQCREKGERNKAFPKLEIHPEDFGMNFDLIIWGGEGEAADKLEEVGSTKILVPGSMAIHQFRKCDVKPKSVTLLKIQLGKISTSCLPLTSSRPFIYRQLFANKLEDTLKNNPSMKTLDAVLEKEIMYLVREYYTLAERNQSNAGLKPLARFRVKFSPTSVIDTEHLEARLKDLVLSFPPGKCIELIRTAPNALASKRSLEQMKDAKSLLNALSSGILAASTAEVSQIGTYVAEAIKHSRARSPFLAELISDPERYLEGSEYVLTSLITRYENAFKEEFLSGPAHEHSQGMKKFLEETSKSISTLESISSRPADLDSFSLNVQNRIEDAFHFTTAARKYIFSHRNSTGNLTEFLAAADERTAREMDELIQEARGMGQTELGKRESSEHAVLGESLVRRLAALPLAGENPQTQLDDDVSGEESEGELQRSRDILRLNALAATANKRGKIPKVQITQELDDISEDDANSYSKVKEWNSPTGSKILEDELMDVMPRLDK